MSHFSVSECRKLFSLYLDSASHVQLNKMETEEVHDDVRCDGCNVKPITGKRYKCIDCNDKTSDFNFNLCAICYNKDIHSDHRMIQLSKGKYISYIH